MGKDSDANVAISGEGVRECLREALDLAPAEAVDPSRRKHLMCFGAYVAIMYVASLRGGETFFADLGTTRRYLVEGKSHAFHPHVVVALLGHLFKGETGERCHLIPLPLETSSGIQVGKWLETLINIRAVEGRTQGLAFCDEKGDMSRSWDFDEMFLKIMERVQEHRPELFLPGENLSKMHGISHSHQKGSMSEAQPAGVKEADVIQMNRWRKVERAKGQQPKFQMMEHYTSVRIAIKTLLQYPATLCSQNLI
jgi:hypothetical protein